MLFPTSVPYSIRGLFGGIEESIILHEGLTIFVGPNGSGKTMVMREVAQHLAGEFGQEQVRFLVGGRLAHLEGFRSDLQGHYSHRPQYDQAYGARRDIEQRYRRSEGAEGQFFALYDKPDLEIKVRERLSRLFQRRMLLEWRDTLRVNFVRTDSTAGEYSSGREASGILHLVVLLTALYDEEAKAILLDEPEVSLHPQYKTFLLREIVRVAGHPDEPGKKS